VALPEGLSGGGIGTEVAATAFFAEKGSFHQQFSQAEALMELVHPFQHGDSRRAKSGVTAWFELIELVPKRLVLKILALASNGFQGGG
jgi:hypothetical protein